MNWWRRLWAKQETLWVTKVAFWYVCPCQASIVAPVPEKVGTIVSLLCANGHRTKVIWRGDHFGVVTELMNSQAVCETEAEFIPPAKKMDDGFMKRMGEDANGEADRSSTMYDLGNHMPSFYDRAGGAEELRVRTIGSSDERGV